MSMYGKFAEGDVVSFRHGQTDRDVGTNTGDKSMAKQEFKEECDINNILKGYAKGRAITHLAKYEGRFEDVADAPTFHEACQVIARAEEMFLDLPSGVRDRFGNNPERFLEFVHDPKNKDELVQMGLAHAPKVEAPAAAPAAPVEPKGGEAT